MVNKTESQHQSPSTEGLSRIRETLIEIYDLVSHIDVRSVAVQRSENGDPTTALDKQINEHIHKTLPREGEGWLSEETKDDLRRLSYERVWVVDPIDGTREAVEGIPEWCVSIALVEGREAVAGGILNPSTGELFLGSRDTGIEILKLEKPRATCAPGDSSCILVSRREHSQGKWDRMRETLPIQPVGSIAYRLARVAAGQAQATCTFDPRSEWDVAAGVALVEISGGKVHTATGQEIRFNSESPKLPSFFAFAKDCSPSIPETLLTSRNS